AVPVRWRCLRHALAAAGENLGSAGSAGDEPNGAEKKQGRGEGVDYLAVAALLPAGRAALAAIAAKADAGFRVFKWKVGVGDLADELALLDDVCAKLPDGAKLRLD